MSASVTNHFSPLMLQPPSTRRATVSRCATSEPALFDAVTVTRIVLLTSPDPSRYVVAVAPPLSSAINGRNLFPRLPTAYVR
jgi:hypothetical protein